MGGQLPLNPNLQGVAWSGCSLPHGLPLERGNDMDIQRRWPATAPGKTSAGLERESGIKFGISLGGAKAADWAALKMTSRMVL